MTNFNISIAFPFIESKIEGKDIARTPNLPWRPPLVSDHLMLATLFFQNTKRFQVKSLKMETNLF